MAKKQRSFIGKVIRFFILIIFVTAIVWTGIKSFVRVDKNYRAVVWTKIGGTKNKVYKAGTYFFPLRIIPSFFKMTLYREEQKPISKIVNINLPFKVALIHAGDFKIQYRVILRYRIKDDALTDLSQGGKYKEFQTRLRNALIEGEKSLIFNKLVKMIVKDTEPFTSQILFNELDNFSNRLLNARFKNYLKIISVKHTLIYMPDIEVYRKHYAIGSALAEKESEKHIRKFIELNYKRQFKNAMLDIELKRIRKYLALMKEKKNVLPFLFLQKLSDKVRLIIVPEGSGGAGFYELLKKLQTMQSDRSNQRHNSNTQR